MLRITSFPFIKDSFIFVFCIVCLPFESLFLDLTGVNTLQQSAKPEFFIFIRFLQLVTNDTSFQC